MSEERTELISIRGLPCRISQWYSRQKIEDTMDFVPGDHDVIVTSYPKTGSIWIMYVILQIESKGEFLPSSDEFVYKFQPLEMSGTAAAQALEKPRCYRTHMPYNYLQKSDRAKYIYIYRKPEDTLVSYYHYAQYFPNHEKVFDTFFKYFLSGNVGYGNYFEHVLSYFKHQNDHNILMVSYERLHTNTRDEILRIAKFMGNDYYETLSKNEQLLCKLVEITSFSHMKKTLSILLPCINFYSSSNPVSEAPKLNFFRKGIIGDGKAQLSGAQRRSLKEAAEKVLKGTSIFDEWYAEDNSLN